MRLFLLPISTRRTLIYCDRVQSQLNIKNGGGGKPNLHDRIVQKCNETWTSWEASPNKYKKRLTDYGNAVFNRISYKEWGLKTLPMSKEDMSPTEVLFPGRFLDKEKVRGVLAKIAVDRQGLHKRRFWGCLVGLPLTLPVGLLPVIPNIPGFYLAFRAWSHYKAFYGSKYLEALLNHKESLIKLAPSKVLDELYAAGLIHPSREDSRAASLPSEEDSNAVADLVTVQSNNDTGDVMLLKRWNGKLLAESFGLPGMEIEIERAVEQVEKSIKAESELAEKKRAIVQGTAGSSHDEKK